MCLLLRTNIYCIIYINKCDNTIIKILDFKSFTLQLHSKFNRKKSKEKLVLQKKFLFMYNTIIKMAVTVYGEISYFQNHTRQICMKL